MRRHAVTLAAVLAVALTARLGWWQLDRAAQKLAFAGEQLQQADRPPLSASELPPAGDEAREAWYRRITVEGHWLPATTLYLDNRQMRGRPGFFVLTALQLPGGDAVLVQRGWLPRDLQERSRIPAYSTPEGLVRLQARMAPPPSRLAQLGEEAAGPIRQNVELSALARETGLRLRAFSLQQLADPAAPADGLLREWPQPAVDVQKHYGYAFQWFALAALIAGLYVWFQLVRPRRLRPEPAA